MKIGLTNSVIQLKNVLQISGLMRIRVFIGIISSSIFLLESTAFSMEQVCERALTNYVQPTLADLHEKAAVISARAKLPKFQNAKEELELQETWGGDLGPAFVNSILPKGVSLIKGSLYGANEESVVKTSTGKMAHLRYDTGRTQGNLGVHPRILFENTFKQTNTLYRADSKLIILFVGGGGTKTTGHHVAANIMSYFNNYYVDVIAIDNPWHTYGDRTRIKKPEDILLFAEDFAKTFLAQSGKPIVFMGHSLGGILADFYMRHYTLDKNPTMSAIYSLSPMADPLLGGSPREKLEKEQEIAYANAHDPNIRPEDLTFGGDLARAGKVSPICGMICQISSVTMNWSLPEHGGKNFLPAVYIIGEGDSLYQGYQQTFDQAIKPLSNASLTVMSQARPYADIDGSSPPMRPGHLIFDHKPHVKFIGEISDKDRQLLFSGKMDEETFKKLKRDKVIEVDPLFTSPELREIETFVRIRKSLEDIFHTHLPHRPDEHIDSIQQAVQAYANNIAFRVFADSFVYINQKATPAGIAAGLELETRNSRIRDLQHLAKRHPLTAEEQKELVEHQAATKKLQRIVKGDGPIDHPNLKQIDQLVAQIAKLTDKMKPLGVEKSKLLVQFEKNAEAIKHLNKFLHAAFGLLEDQRTHDLFYRRETVFANYMRLDEKTYRAIAYYLIGRFENPNQIKNDVMTEVPKKLQASFDQLEELSAQYGVLNSRLNQVSMELALNGQGKLKPGNYEDLVARLPSKSIKYLAAQKIIRLYKNYRGEDKMDVYDQAKLKKYLVEQIQKFAREVQMLTHENERINERITGRTGKPNQAQAIAASIDRAIADLNSQIFHLRMEKNKLVGSEHMTYSNYTVNSVLDADKNQVAKNFVAVNSVLQRLWAEWTKIWSARLEESDNSWY